MTWWNQDNRYCQRTLGRQSLWSTGLLIYSEVLHLWDRGCCWQENNSKLPLYHIKKYFLGKCLVKLAAVPSETRVWESLNDFAGVVLMRKRDQSVGDLRIRTSSRERKYCYISQRNYTPEEWVLILLKNKKNRHVVIP